MSIDMPVRGTVGRDREVSTLVDALDDDGPRVTFVHGLAGIGKTVLVRQFEAVAIARSWRVARVDCANVAPTEAGIVQALASACGSVPVVDAIVDGIRSQPTVVVLDTYERFRLLDSWVRQALVPALGDRARLVVASRDAPVAQWFEAGSTFRSFRLGPLSPRAAEELLLQWGLDAAAVTRVQRLAHGHPLTLVVAAAAVRERPDLTLEDAALGAAIGQVTRSYLSDLPPGTRAAVEAAALVRRATTSLLEAMLDRDGPALIDDLVALPFVDVGRDGLAMHEAVQTAVAAALRSTDPVLSTDLRRRAWRQLRRELRAASPSDLWRYTADMLWLVENPVVREAFFPTDSPRFSVDPARPDDQPAIHAIISRHEPPETRPHIEKWVDSGWAWVVRGEDDAVAGFYLLAAADDVPLRWLLADPVTRSWAEHLQRSPVPPGQRVLLMRRWLDGELGDRPGPVQAACWLDVKRAYVELRPQLRRVYTTTDSYDAYAPVIARLTFEPVPNGAVSIGGHDFGSAVLDFGPASVDGWLEKLAAAELGITDELVDAEGRQLIIDDQRLDLTPLEFAVLAHLRSRGGAAVPRAELLSAVWGTRPEIASNVVDSTVRKLRAKLGERADVVETVRGVGYRLRTP